MTHFFHLVDSIHMVHVYFILFLLLNNIPLDITLYLSIHWLMDIWGVSIFLAIMDNAAMDEFLYGHVFISLGYLSKMWNCQHMVTMFYHLRSCQTVFHSDCTTLHSHQQCMNFLFLQILDNTGYCLSFLLWPT